MPTVNLSPVFLDAQLDSSGNPYSGAKLFTYAAGSSTKTNTYTSSAGSVAQTNPIVLNSRGEPTNGPIWLIAGTSYKFVLAGPTDTDPPGSPIRTIDNVVGVNDTAASAQSQWVAGPTPTYISATTFSLVGDQTTDFEVGRRIKHTVTAGTVYGEIINSAFTTVTTITVLLDSGSLDSGLSAVSLGITTAANPSIPVLLRGACGRLTYVSATSIKLVPYQGDRIMVKKSATWNARKIPSAGISAANTSVYVNGTAGQNLAASTLYYVYLFDLAGVLTADFSTTARATDADTGIEIKSGDASRALIGMVRTNASSQFDATAMVLSWYGRRRIHRNASFSTTRTTTSTSTVELHSEIRTEFLTWSDESFLADFAGRAQNSSLGAGMNTSITIDGITTIILTVAINAAVANSSANVGFGVMATTAEGYHYLTIAASVSAGTGSWDGTLFVATQG